MSARALKAELRASVGPRPWGASFSNHTRVLRAISLLGPVAMSFGRISPVGYTKRETDQDQRAIELCISALREIIRRMERGKRR